MMGIANQLLAAIALAVGTTYLLQHAPKRIYALCTAHSAGVRRGDRVHRRRRRASSCGGRSCRV